MGDEERRIIQPAIDRLSADGIDVRAGNPTMFHPLRVLGLRCGALHVSRPGR